MKSTHFKLYHQGESTSQRNSIRNSAMKHWEHWQHSQSQLFSELWELQPCNRWWVFILLCPVLSQWWKPTMGSYEFQQPKSHRRAQIKLKHKKKVPPHSPRDLSLTFKTVLGKSSIFSFALSDPRWGLYITVLPWRKTSKMINSNCLTSHCPRW